MKKIIFSIMIMLLTTISVSAANPELTVFPAAGTEGGQVEVTVEISESDVVGGSFVVGYDDTVLSPVSVTRGPALNGRAGFDNLNYDRNGIKGVSINFIALHDSNKVKIPLDSGVLCTIVFDVLETEVKTSNVYIAHAVMSDKNLQAMEYSSNSGMIYLNQFVCDAVFTKDGVETNKLSDSGMALNLGVFNGTKVSETSWVYVAQYTTDGKLLAIKKIEYTLSSGDDSSETILLDVEKEAQTMKVMCWDEGNIPFGGIFQIER